MPTLTQDYEPAVAEFDSATDLYLYDDGWKIVELHSEHDLIQLGTITKNCIGPRWFPQLLPAPEGENAEAEAEATARRLWDTEENRERLGQEWIEKQVAQTLRYSTAKRCYRIAALIDTDNRPYAAIILGEKDAVDGGCSYSSYRDLGQETTLTLDGQEFYLLQATWGISWCPQPVAERCAEWWKDKVGGEWDEESFQAKVERYNPAGKPRTTYAY